jgi:hypothetical protein
MKQSKVGQELDQSFCAPEINEFFRKAFCLLEGGSKIASSKYFFAERIPQVG